MTKRRAPEPRISRVIVSVIVSCMILLLLAHTDGVSAQRFPSDLSPDQSSTCGYGPTHRLSQVRESAIHEASALAASRQWPGIFWTFNDAGNTPTVFAFDEDGQPRGTFQVANAANVDWEALQLGPDGEGQDALYIGDIGDNKHRRRESVIYRIPEPEPRAAEGPSSGGATAPATVFRFSYPVAARNVEAMLVHPITGEIVLISQNDTGFGMVYRLPLPLSDRMTMPLELAGVVDARSLGSHGGQITDATISPDARRVIVRTYTRALLYDVPEGASLRSIWSQPPRVFQLDDGPKGEGLTYRPDSLDLVSIGEGMMPILYQTDWHCRDGE